MRYAIIKNNFIERVIIANTMEDAILSATELYKLEVDEFDISEVGDEVCEQSLIKDNRIIPPKPYGSWVLLENDWQPPKSVPQDDTVSWAWNEINLVWVQPDTDAAVATMTPPR